MQAKQDPVSTNEIAEVNVFAYVLALWKPIAAFTLAGTLLAAALLTQMRSEFEASALIEMAKIPAAATDVSAAPIVKPSGMLIEPTGVLIEPTGVLIERLRIPTTYTPEVIGECGFDREPAPAEATAIAVEASVPRGLHSVLRIAVRKHSPDSAKRCIESLFKMIRHQQDEMVKVYKDELEVLLSQLQLGEGVKVCRDVSDNNVGLLMYLVQRDENFFVRRRIDEVKRALARDVRTRLVSPPFASETMVAPRTGRTIAIGAGAGMMFGFLFGAGWRMARERRSEKRMPAPGP